jgi:hypothetical protein
MVLSHLKLKVMLILECNEEWFNNFNVVPISGSEQGQVVGTHEYSVECSGFAECGEFSDYPRNCAFLKDYCTELGVAHHSKLIWRWGETTE